MTAATSGRPLRFFLLLLVGWIATRFLLASGWSAPGEMAGRDIVASPPATLFPTAQAHQPVVDRRFGATRPLPPPAPTRHRTPAPASMMPRQGEAGGEGMPVDLLDFIRVTTAYANRHYASDYGMAVPAMPPLVAPPVFAPSGTAGRWTATLWAYWRDRSGIGGTASPGRLGGSQIGARVDVDLSPQARSRTTAYLRASSALDRPAAPEVAVGIALQPRRAVPVSLMAERRIALGKGGRDAMALLIVGGFGPQAFGPALEAEGYGQAGVVGVRSGDLFTDGKLSLLHPVPDTRLRLGASISGGAQPAVSRLDIGPEVQWRLPLPHANARIGLEWRQRVAGNAAPPSGLAVTLATDF